MPRFGSRGVSLTELMIATALLSIGILGMVGSFQYITKALAVSRARTLATNLGQEKVELLKNLSYYQLLITTPPFATDGTFTPPITYDSNHYPPETISIGGINFQRYTFVALAQVDNNVISTVTYTYPDTGLKQITVHVIWMQNQERKKWTLQNLYENPNINPLDSSFSGTISSAGTPSYKVAGAKVVVQENQDWNATADANGQWSFRVSKGSYTVRASSAGWYDMYARNVLASAGSNTVVDMAMVRIASGALTGLAWMNTGPVITQVVVQTSTFKGDGGGADDVEYVELFNPTTFQFPVGSNVPAWKYLKLNYYHETGSDCNDACFDLQYGSTYIAPGKYYLIASATQFMILGQWVTPDAIYAAPGSNYLRRRRSGCVELTDPDGNKIDRVGWEDDGSDGDTASLAPCAAEGAAVPDWDPAAFPDGIDTGTQLVRVSSPAARLENIDDYGRAYDSDDNRSDFLIMPAGGFGMFQVPPHNTRQAAMPVITGKPAVSALVTASDVYSGSTRAYASYIASNTLSLLSARFVLDGVTTGAFTLLVSSGQNYKEVYNAVVVANLSKWVPNPATSPAELAPGYYAVQLESAATAGFVEGTVTDVGGRPVPGITVLAGGYTKITSANGTYFTPSSTGSVTVIANPGNLNGAYVEGIGSTLVDVGQVATQNFQLSQGGSLRGYVTTGTTPLPNIVVSAKIGGSQYGTGTSDGSGYFTIRNLSTTTFTLEPALEIGQSASPTSMSGTVLNSQSVFVGTFTIAGAFGSIRGTVRDSTAGNALVTSGALILVSTVDISSPPPAIYGSSAPAMTPLYAVSSRADGSYEIQARGSTSQYKLAIYYPKINANGTITTTTKVVVGIPVNAAQATTLDILLP